MWGLPKFKDTIRGGGVPVIRIIIYRGVYWGPPIMETAISHSYLRFQHNYKPPRSPNIPLTAL